VADATGAEGTQKSGSFIVRTVANAPASQAPGQGTNATSAQQNSLALAALLREEVSRARPELRVSNVRTQTEINARHTLRERLLATLAVFFAAVALLLATVGVYGVLHYTVVQRRRELGIRIAVGAPAGTIARLVATNIAVVIGAGGAVGIVAGLAGVRSIESLLYQVKATDPQILVLPILVIIVAATAAATPAILRATRIDPAALLRTD
jgi:predicted lysophospholipase L1 biosynthesis ABC-type transport system permease subunit